MAMGYKYFVTSNVFRQFCSKTCQKLAILAQNLVNELHNENDTAGPLGADAWLRQGPG